MKLILQPCSNKLAQQHFFNTITTKININSIKEFLPIEIYNKIKNECGLNVAIWGVKPNNLHKFDKIEENDLVVFSANRKLYHKGYIVQKTINNKLAKFLWNMDNDAMTWSCIYFLKDTSPIDIDIVDFNKIMGYKDNYIIQGFSIINDDRSYAIKELIND